MGSAEVQIRRLSSRHFEIASRERSLSGIVASLSDLVRDAVAYADKAGETEFVLAKLDHL